MRRVLVTGGCGYIGSVLVPKLVSQGHKVGVVDIGWFGFPQQIWPENNLLYAKKDFRQYDGECDAIIHLANIANDPAGELDPRLTWETNALGMAQLADKAVKSGVKQFIYLSSGSIYGISDSILKEDSPLVPLTEYNKSKAVAERVLLSYSDKMDVQIIRPGTVCGVSPRQRLDITVNGMTCGACFDRKIKVVEGKQHRPNVHIEDITDLILWMLERPATGIWNAGFENLTGFEIAEIVKEYLGDLPVVESKSKDRRSYRMDSSKIMEAGFEPKHTVQEAVGDLISAYAAGMLKDEDRCFNLRIMRQLH